MDGMAHLLRPESGPWNLPLVDLDEGAVRSAGDLANFRGARILVTGGTGFLGSWLVASLLRSNVLFDLDVELVLLTRNPDLVPLEEGSGLSFLRGDVRSLPDPGQIDLVIHGAASSSSTFGRDEGAPQRMAATIVEGTQAVLELATKNSARVLFLSSGAVYGPQINAVDEACLTAPDPMDTRSAYGQAKRLAETLCVAATETGNASVVVARLFAFVGPRIPLHAHFAAGNFLSDVLAGRAVTIQGDGRPRRSYLYTGDLPEWCWALLARGRSGTAYNVGSPEPVTIAELAGHIAAISTPPVEVRVLGKSQDIAPPWYVPTIDRAEKDLGLKVRTDLAHSLSKTFAWLAAESRQRE
jgi:dTDP-glucose 4,6-dehydratase